MTIEEAIQELAKIFKQALDNIGDCFQRIREQVEEEPSNQSSDKSKRQEK